jgi:hypothetical protein
MFRITNTSDGKSLGMTEAPTYIKQAENGCYILCPEPEASGIVISGIPYRLLGREAPEGMGDLDTVMLEETDAGPMVAAAHELSSDIDGLTVDHEYRLSLLELGLAGASETV